VRKTIRQREALTGTAIMLYNDSQRKEAEEAVHRMVKRAVDMEGTVTGEHGVGLVKRDYLNHELGETTVDAMRKVRFNLDFPLTPR
jgi:D-lactate dehydrogenase (cytochrome)